MYITASWVVPKYSHEINLPPKWVNQTKIPKWFFNLYGPCIKPIHLTNGLDQSTTHLS